MQIEEIQPIITKEIEIKLNQNECNDIGNQEVWKDINDWFGYYQISNFGRVRSVERIVNNRKYFSRFMNKVDLKDYKAVILSRHPRKDTLLIHRLVGIHFIDNPNNLPEINHKDCNKSNNHISNLEWSTHLDNIKHAIKNGRMEHIYGENNSKSKLTWENVKKIRKDFIENPEINCINLSEKYKINKCNIIEIINNNHWKDDEYQKIVDSGIIRVKQKLQTTGSKNTQAKLSENDVLKIRELYNNGLNINEIHKDFSNISKHNIYSIIKRLRWKHI